MDISKRSDKKELLDGDEIPFEDIRQNMKELSVINRWLGGHRITRKGFRMLLDGRKTLTVCEVGCGGGDNLRTLQSWCKGHGIDLRCIGVDIRKECIDFARSQQQASAGFTWICSDYRTVLLPVKPDIIFNSLFCHHFSDNENRELFQWMRDNSSLGFFINDLHRHPIAYHSIRWLTRLFSRSYLVKNDAPLSVLRGFRKNELEILLEACFPVTGLNSPYWSLQWAWAFRWLITVRHERNQII